MKLPKHRRDEAALNSRLIRRPIKRMVWLFLLPTFGAFCIEIGRASCRERVFVPV